MVGMGAVRGVLYALMVLVLLRLAQGNRQRERRYNQEIRQRTERKAEQTIDPASILRDDERGAEIERLSKAAAAAAAAAAASDRADSDLWTADAFSALREGSDEGEPNKRKLRNTRRSEKDPKRSAEGTAGSGEQGSGDDAKGLTCPPCPAHPMGSDSAAGALFFFWKGNMHEEAYACACQALIAHPDNGMSQAITHALSRETKADLAIPAQLTLAPAKDGPALDIWQVLGPFPVSKLEIDADPVFDSMQPRRNLSVGASPALATDPAVAILTHHERRVMTELLPHGAASWRVIRASPQGVVGVQFPGAQWQDLAASLQTPTIYEFQAWARASTWVRAAGSYYLNCQGMHTLYLRTASGTRLLHGDVYNSGQFVASVDLPAGPVGLAVPLRGVAQTQFYCQLVGGPVERAASLRALPPRHVPHLLTPLRQSEMHGFSRRTAFAAGLDEEWYHKENRAVGHGMLLGGSALLTLPVSNALAHPLGLAFKIEPRDGAQRHGEFSVHLASTASGKGTGESSSEPLPPLIVAPGQTLLVPLEMFPEPAPAEGRGTWLPCVPSPSGGGAMLGPKFKLTVTPSRGRAVQVEFQFECRMQNQSFLFSYLDHDGSVSQAATVFPLPTLQQRAAWSSAESSMSGASKALPPVCEDDSASEATAGCQTRRHYPVLLTLHGTGISPLSQADAYKTVPPGAAAGAYRFGVEGLFVLAPSRFGAHNWEGVGALSASAALAGLRRLLARQPTLPQVSSRARGIIAGHSMGGHGALMLAANEPSRFACLSSTALWIAKESYSVANAFFQGDVQLAFTAPRLQALLLQSLSEFHPDRLASNMAQLRAHIRVGGSDATTHPYFSRRMLRLLQREGANATLEEVKSKEHWWWDTKQDNDGGVLNDGPMRAFYRECEARSRGITGTASAVEAATASAAALVSFCPLGAPGFTVRAINPGNQRGLCGLAVEQQDESFSLSTIRAECSLMETEPAQSPSKVLRCNITTSNTRRLRVSLSPASFGPEAAFAALSVVINGHEVLGLKGTSGLWPGDADEPSADAGALVCLEPGLAAVCSPPSPLAEKTPLTHGPIRAAYARTLLIVYGTPPNRRLRLALRDVAVYLGNALATSHASSVRVVSDLEFKGSDVSYAALMAGILLVGGPAVNKAARALYGNNATADAGVGVGVRSRATVFFSADASSTDGDDGDSESQAGHDLSAKVSFEVGGHRYDSASHAVISTFPLEYGGAINSSTPSTPRLGLVLHANSVEGYWLLSRLAWPVVPPMVRAPFAAYLPDFVVVDDRLWGEGFGGVAHAGFWDWKWEYDARSSFQRED